jgi:hypothetical protein
MGFVMVRHGAQKCLAQAAKNQTDSDAIRIDSDLRKQRDDIG